MKKNVPDLFSRFQCRVDSNVLLHGKTILFSMLLFFTMTAMAQEWRHYTMSNSDLPSQRIQAILISDDGGKWFGTDQGLCLLKAGRWYRFSVPDGLTSNSIHDLVIQRMDVGYRLWIAGDQGLTVAEITADQVRFTAVYTVANSALPENAVRSVALDPRGAVWVGTNRGAAVLANNTFRAINRNNYLTSNLVRDIASDDDGLVHIATQGGGVARLRLDPLDVITSASTVVSTWTWLQSDTINALLIDGEHQWYGTGEGAFRHTGLDSKLKWRVYQTMEGLIDNRIQCMAKDSTGRIWFGTPSGVSALAGDSFTNHTGLISKNVLDIAVDLDGSIWCATDAGVSVYSSATRVKQFKHLPEKYQINAFPNPFNAETRLRLQAPAHEQVELFLYDVNGRQVRHFLPADFSTGVQELHWNGMDEQGRAAPTGLYLAVMKSRQRSAVCKILMVK